MKKKFLSLMMAAAVVATTSVSAFADETVTKDGSEVNVTVTGSVNNNQDVAPAGTLNVTVPTALTFSVNSSGNLTGSEIVVTNRGTEKIDVFAYQFIDPTPEEGIIVKRNLSGGSEKRNEVTLSLQGNEATANFASSAGDKKGIYGPTTATINDDGMKISTIGTGSQNTDTLYLRGTAGKQELDTQYTSTGMSEKFTLRLKIKKAPAQN
ncbi:hypothetical protein [Clostridium sp.]|uniref:hypothetical protein n=1 Tax=Clostridium sp. TaxID=1506 RepID=UPI002E77D96C|nr:hypothetical protein [Clostridium sp.]MEE0567727.1 hypothetical protein [Clostridium sp.]